MNKNKQKESKN